MKLKIAMEMNVDHMVEFENENRAYRGLPPMTDPEKLTYLKRTVAEESGVDAKDLSLELVMS